MHASVFRISLCSVSLAFALSSCRSETTDAKTETAKASEPVSASSSPSSKAPVGPKPKKRQLYHVPVGPAFAVLPGQGIGPIRFGATVSTIERLMEARCAQRTPTRCRYYIQAVDFYLKDGVAERIHIHGQERSFDGNEEHTFGIFNGMLPNGAELGMYREYVIEAVGEPVSTQDAKPGLYPTVRKDTYDGMVLEYDKLKNGNVVLAGIILTKSETAQTSPSPKDAKKATRPVPKPAAKPNQPAPRPRSTIGTE